MNVDEVVSELESKAQSNGDVDYLKLRTGYDIINKVAAYVFGYMLVILLITIPLVIVLEVCYINIPLFRGTMDKLDNKCKVKGNGFVTKTMQLTLHDAKKALELANTTQTGRSANIIYLKLKVRWIFITMFCLALYICGTGTIINAIMYFLSGLLSIIKQTLSNMIG